MPTPGTPSEQGAVGADDWDEAPCGLLVLDERDRVRAANARFLDLTGYALDDVVARPFWNELVTAGGRVLYQTQLAPVLELDGALNEVMVELRTANGDRVPTLLNARRVADAAGKRVATRIALMSVPDRRGYENELRRARHEAEQAREDADAARRVDATARRRLELLSRADTALASPGDVGLVLKRLARVLVTDFADWCLIYTPDIDEPDVMRWSAAAADTARQPPLEHLAELLPEHTGPRSALRGVLDGGTPILLADVSERWQREATESEDVLAALAELGIGSALVAPCIVRGARVGAMILARGPGLPAFAADDLTDLTDIAARTGIVIDNLHRTAREHSNSVALQQALLTAPPQVPGLQIVIRYVPATTGNEIGGDWYDAFLQPDGTPVLAIGDVVGHDIYAAAAMGQLRGVIRTVGYTTSATPAEILTRADAAARGLRVEVLATTVIARIEGVGADVATLGWSNAGHPPPILITADGPRLLDAAPDRPLGIGRRADRARHDRCVEFRHGDILLLYTDGLIERRDEDLDAALDRLIATLAQAPATDLEALCDLVLTDHGDGARDDIALLAVRVVDP